MRYTSGVCLLIIGIVLLGTLIFQSVKEYYDFKTNYKSYWELSDRSSTLQAKEQYISKFIEQIENNKDKFAEYNAVIFKTPQSSFKNNLKAVETLRDRLISIQGMNETDFAYQTAIQQITEQEQGEAQSMLRDIEGAFILKSYPLIWGWYGIISVLASLIFTFCKDNLIKTDTFTYRIMGFKEAYLKECITK